MLANGGVFAVAALFAASGRVPGWDWAVVAFGALAAAASDTWATEIGTLAARPPRSIVSLKVLPTGTSGGVGSLTVLLALVYFDCPMLCTLLNDGLIAAVPQ